MRIFLSYVIYNGLAVDKVIVKMDHVIVNDHYGLDLDEVNHYIVLLVEEVIY